MELPQTIAVCGVDCAACGDYRQGTCPSCRLTQWLEGDACMPVTCCGDKGITVCGQCGSFPCADMAAFYEESDSHREALRRMQSLREPD